MSVFLNFYNMPGQMGPVVGPVNITVLPYCLQLFDETYDSCKYIFCSAHCYQISGQIYQHCEILTPDDPMTKKILKTKSRTKISWDQLGGHLRPLPPAQI